ncbi:hypothetical protein [Gordonia sp. (in: high G+C Gram-positive bacteria)]|jgi:hypothetical protein|uniref:hypothetical protein n=1 Tax=Gordonia sp. (in: high G+C Gram-positive bacteria) TaxID=84139 RepID=UPI001E0628DB|nr:hypothetical protein [Gordonia sp. (in: high G+C Gram-positive bacteria)]MCB1293533.1 hypothetical protein [Gordonia sp. (in: high G+C Gram-positive bacteria)]HMS76799.1 hypothetical protein [Gordonia sp. (in: high G+C Gram-positive bacteria)]HQV18247.1 hypothetical protein [Gordonia sp. (in: high G+C Gram-positive bacteria)]
MPIPSDWTPYRREDGELLGWIVADDASGDAWTSYDVLGRAVAAGADWLDAEVALDDHGLHYLADPYMLEGVWAQPLRVRLVEVTPERIVVKEEDFGDMTAKTERFVLPWPMPTELRSVRPDDPDGFTFGASH